MPNVTTVLAPLMDWSKVSPEVLEDAQRLGTAVHKATELDDHKDLDEETVDEAVLPYLLAWRSFRGDSGFMPVAIEERIFCKRHFYAGTLDRIGWLNGKRVLIDIKTGILTAAAGPQLAAYQEAKNHRTKDKVEKRYAVQLKGDGTYSLKEYTDPTDLTVFLALLTLHNWRQMHDC